MKKMMMMMVMMTTIVVSAKAMTYSQAREEALFLTDKMAYELALTNSQLEEVYKINLDYLMALTSQSSLYGAYWTQRDAALHHVLTAYQYQKYAAANYFYRPVAWSNNRFTFNIYRTYTNRTHFYRSHPAGYATYRGKVSASNRNWRTNAASSRGKGAVPMKNRHSKKVVRK